MCGFLSGKKLEHTGDWETDSTTVFTASTSFDLYKTKQNG